jgi:alkylation response protein AidB-like acyl-CoA dehydrogenase
VDYELSTDQKLFRQTTKDFLDKEIPLTTVRQINERGGGFDRSWWRRGAELGWTSMLVSPDFGGDSISGSPLLDIMIVAEEMGRLVSPGPLTVTNAVVASLSEASNAAAHQETIDGLMSGELVASWALYEPDRGFDPAGVQVEMVPDGSGYVVSGTKTLVESADQADVLLVTARAPEGLTQFVLSTAAPGVTVSPLESLDFVRTYAEVRLEGVIVPAEALVGDAGTAAEAVERQLQLAVMLQCAELGGVVERTLEFTIQWAFDRYSFGRPLASYQALKHRFADMKLWLEASHGTTEAAARAVQERRADAGELVSVAKSYVGQRATDIIQDCVQLHGGIGVTWEHDIHLYLRRATVDRATWGTPSDHRQRIATFLGM